MIYNIDNYKNLREKIIERRIRNRLKNNDNEPVILSYNSSNSTTEYLSELENQLNDDVI